jgi:hypothetical protein
MIRVAASVCLVFIAIGAESARACSVPFIRTLANQTVDGFMTTRSGRPCGIVLRRSPGPTHSAEIVARPSNGSVAVSPGNRIVYRSRAGFVGSDTFAYARRGLDTRNNPITRTVRISVKVTP